MGSEREGLSTVERTKMHASVRHRLMCGALGCALAFWATPAQAVESVEANDDGAKAVARAEGLDSRSEARVIGLNQSVTNYLTSSVDEDYYRFSLSAPGSVSLTFSSDFVDDNRGWKYRLIDAQGEEFALWTHYESNVGDQTTMDIGLPAGTYYVVVKARDDHAAAHTDAPYTFRVNYTQRSDWETEWNGDRGIADQIVPGEQYFGSLMRSTDDDFYTFDLASSASVSLEFGSDFLDERNGWKLTIRNARNEALGTWRIYHDNIGDYRTEAVSLPAGKYYVVVESRDNHAAAWSPDTYHFRVNALSNYGFSDVNPGDWYATDDVLGYATSHGLLSGYGNGLFGPYDSVTRGQVATILWRIAGQPNVAAQDFSDVDYSQFYGTAVRWARATGVISGYGDSNTFGPNDPVTREQLCVMLSNYASKIAHRSVASDCAALDRISGSWEVSSWAREQMGWAVDRGILSGEMVNGTAYANPNGTALRCALAKMVSVFHRDVLHLG